MGMQEPCPLCGVVEWAHGVKYEQERIIKLLEDDFWHDLVPTQQIVLASGTYVSGRYHHAKNCHGCRFIALIKGEN